MTIKLRAATDFNRVYTFVNADGATLEISDASFSAWDSSDNVVLSLPFSETPPDEAAIALLDPDKRGYLSPIVGASLELHVSDMAVIPVGTYSYELMVSQTDADYTQGQEVLAMGQFIVSDQFSLDVTIDDIAAWRGVSTPTGAEASALQLVINAAMDTISLNLGYPADLSLPGVRQAVIMQASRLWKRRDSPGGVESYDEYGAIRVTRFDPDIEALLAPFRTYNFA